MSVHPELKKPVFLALDVDDAGYALELAKKFKDHVGGFKIGPRLAYQMGGEWSRNLAELGPLFVDNKYHDIPSTMCAAVRASFEAGASFCTVHVSAGEEALTELVKLEAELSKERPFRLLGVTVLTSQKAQPEDIMNLATFGVNQGLQGLVCSAHEVAALRIKFPDAFLLTPGIRWPGQSTDDQSRVMSPPDALAAGSSALVMGRAILKAEDPIKALEF